MLISQLQLCPQRLIDGAKVGWDMYDAKSKAHLITRIYHIRIFFEVLPDWQKFTFLSNSLDIVLHSHSDLIAHKISSTGPSPVPWPSFNYSRLRNWAVFSKPFFLAPSSCHASTSWAEDRNPLFSRTISKDRANHKQHHRPSSSNLQAWSFRNQKNLKCRAYSSTSQ